MKKFWRWNRTEEQVETPERTLVLRGVIAEDSWLDDKVTPGLFKEELDAGEGNVTVWINSPGGDCFAAAQIYNMLAAYPGKVTVKVDAVAASSATVVAMAGDEVQMSPVAMMMIHNPAMMAAGDHKAMEKAIEALRETKESILNAYERRTYLSRAKLSKLMEDETWMDARKAVELGFADRIIEPGASGESLPGETPAASLYSERECSRRIIGRLTEKYKPPEDAVKPAAKEDASRGRSIAELENRLQIIRQFI
nr:MAG TPA: Putative ATP dependent Clp protease [Caudoviricetes sp.]